MKSAYPRTFTYAPGQPKNIDSLVQSIAFDGGDYIVLQHDSYAGDVLVERNLRLQIVDGDDCFNAEQIDTLFDVYHRLGGTDHLCGDGLTLREFLRRTHGRGALWVKS